ncbi:MAG: hypothetical protein QXU32_00190 [Nitrososphaerales archaeon]
MKLHQYNGISKICESRSLHAGNSVNEQECGVCTDLWSRINHAHLCNNVDKENKLIELLERHEKYGCCLDYLYN